MKYVHVTKRVARRITKDSKVPLPMAGDEVSLKTGAKLAAVLMISKWWRRDKIVYQIKGYVADGSDVNSLL